jgi:hypothetical protein
MVNEYFEMSDDIHADAVESLRVFKERFMLAEAE